MNNLKRLKKLVLANKETRRLYRMMQFLAIFMVISCTIIIVVAKWIEHDQNQKREELFESWDEVFLDVPAEDLNYFKQNAFLEQISIQSIQEKVFLEGDKRVVIGSCDDNFLEMGNIELLEGRMPEKENEVAIEEEYLEVLGVTSVGDIVPLNSEVNCLRGYQIVGKIENYSARWKIINQRINFANCLVYGSKMKKYNIYIEYSFSSNKDPEINFINYYNNIRPFDLDDKELYKYFFTILSVEVFLLFVLHKKVKRRNDNKLFINKKWDYIYYLLLTVIIFSLFMSTTYIVREIYYFQSLNPVRLIKPEFTINANFERYNVENNTINYLFNVFDDSYQIKYSLEFPLNEVLNVITHLIQIVFFMTFMVFIIYTRKSNYVKENRVLFTLREYYYMKEKINIDMNRENFWIIIIFCLFVFIDFLVMHLNIDYLTSKERASAAAVYFIAISLFLTISNLEVRFLLRRDYKKIQTN